LKRVKKAGGKVIARLEMERALSVPEIAGRRGLYKTTAQVGWQVL
jgi:hypothetical protein